VTQRLPRVALLVLLVGLALHNLAMALLWQAGIRDTALDVVAAWKDALLIVAVAAGARWRTAESSSSTGCSRNRGSAVTRLDVASSTRSGTTCSLSARTSSAG